MSERPSCTVAWPASQCFLCQRSGFNLSLGSCDHARPVRSLTWDDRHVRTLSGVVAFTVVSRCSPPDLVRLRCSEGAPRRNCARVRDNTVVSRP
jgi:hypothetical protein